MVARPNPKILSREEERALTEDILTRLDLQRTMKEHSMPVLYAELGVWNSMVHQITRGEYGKQGPRRFAPEVIEEVRRRRHVWLFASALMENYSIDALAAKYGVCVSTIGKRIHKLKSRAWRRPATEVQEAA